MSKKPLLQAIYSDSIVLYEIEALKVDYQL